MLLSLYLAVEERETIVSVGSYGSPLMLVRKYGSVLADEMSKVVSNLLSRFHGDSPGHPDRRILLTRPSLFRV